MSVEVMFVALGGMVTFLVMIHIIAKSEVTKARAGKASEADTEAMKRLIEENNAETARLRARVEVLERLATDEDRRLAGEINRLHAEQRV